MKTISFKLILAVALATIVTFGIYTYYGIKSQSAAMTDEVERHISQLSETVKSSTRFDMLFNQRERIHQTINTIGQESSIHNIRVLNKVGAIMYSSRESEIGTMVDKGAESCYGCHSADKPIERLDIENRTRIFRPHPDSARVLGIINPIYNEKSCWEADCHAHSPQQTVLGVLDVSISLREVDRQIHANEIKAIGFAVIAVIVFSLLIGYFIRRWVHAPVHELVTATKAVAMGNLDHVITRIPKDELGTLARSFNDMTRRLAEVRSQLFQSSKLASLGRLAAGVAHELNNPLTGVLTYSSFLLKRAGDDTEMKEDLEVIVRETKRSREIIKGLLDFARQSTPVKSAIDLREVIDRSLTVITNQLTINNVKVVRVIPEQLPRPVVDANQIQQVFINLLVNAVDALAGRGGTITISIEELALSPRGTAQIRNATCPNDHRLIDTDHRIDGQPSIKVKTRFNNNEGFVHLDPVYGRSHHHYGISFSKNGTAQFFCPECNVSLIDAESRCPECRSPIFSITVPGRGMWRGCTKYGCEWQEWTAVDKGGVRSHLQIQITDTGCGIPAEELGKIFEPFFTTKGQKGTGLGLAVVWGIIDAHEGKVTVSSTVGQGTTFTIRLPVEQSTGSASRSDS